MEFPIPQTLIDSFDRVFIHRDSLSSEVAQRVLKYFPQSKIELVTDDPWKDSKSALSAKDFELSKKTLFLTKFHGHFFKRCPGATQKKTLTCCNYYVLNLGSQCNMNCSYCYLQSYLNSAVTKIFTNIEEALDELQVMAEQHPHLPYRVGTGEITDSLSLDEITLYSRKLIEFFKKFPAWTLEFKTKSDRVKQFLDLSTPESPLRNIVVSWSLNPPRVIESEEHGTAQLEDRILAAQLCLEAGYSLAFHLDPILWHQGWKESYSFLVQKLCEAFSPEEVKVISLGTLRFQPEQRHIMKERFGMKSWVTSAEMFLSEGGKMRYDTHLRNEMLQFVLKEFRQKDPRWNIFLCMETPETWISNFEKTPLQVQGLKDYFRPLPQIPESTPLEKKSQSLSKERFS